MKNDSEPIYTDNELEDIVRGNHLRTDQLALAYLQLKVQVRKYVRAWDDIVAGRDTPVRKNVGGILDSLRKASKE